jgi:dTDP-4-dehydrorhamnose reductase
MHGDSPSRGRPELATGPIAVTGANGRLGSALIRALGARNHVAWTRPEYDLDSPHAAERLLDRDRPALVFHCAAWTNVDGCALDPQLAERRNATAVGELADACAALQVSLVVISTNEVFDGERTDRRGYTEGDAPRPINAYGASKLAGERAAADAFNRRAGLWIVRTAWLFGPPGNDFPMKIVAAADRLPPDEPLAVVSDEVGSPTFASDLAVALLALVEVTGGGLYHLVNEGRASRYEWATQVLARARPDRSLRPISRTAFSRPSRAPAWGVLGTERAPREAYMRHWTEAVDEYLATAVT